MPTYPAVKLVLTTVTSAIRAEYAIQVAKFGSSTNRGRNDVGPETLISIGNLSGG